MGRFLLLAGLAIVLSSSPVQAGAISPGFEAILTPSCAPWDGAALNIEVTFDNGKKFTAMIWREAIDDLKAGRPVTLEPEGVENMQGPGYGHLCAADGPATSCAAVGATLLFPPEPYTGESTGLLRLTLPASKEEGADIQYNVKPRFQDRMALCG